jgi:hypothetical protein
MNPTNILLHRDDDVSVFTCLHTFKEIHKQFIAAKQAHYAVVIMKDLWLNQGIFYYLATAPYLEIGLHGWEHKDYSLSSYEECYDDIKKSLEYWRENSDRMIGKHKKINIFFAPWNKDGENIRKACTDLGLRFCNVKKGNWEGHYIKSFHWWSVNENFKV